MHDSYCLYSLSHSAMFEISVMLISTILLCDILLILLLFLYMFNNFLYVYGPCVCNKDILLLLLLLHITKMSNWYRLHLIISGTNQKLYKSRNTLCFFITGVFSLATNGWR